MFKVKWDAQNNGIILSDNITDEAIPAPRPVYLQELQILEVNKNNAKDGFTNLLEY